MRHGSGGSGDDTVEGGTGQDEVDGGAGSDVLDAGNGTDVAIYVRAENLGSTDIYDGGNGQDLLRLVLTQAEASNAAVQADIAAFEAFLASHPKKTETFTFSTMDLTVRGFEDVEVAIAGGGGAATITQFANGDFFFDIFDRAFFSPSFSFNVTATTAGATSFTLTNNDDPNLTIVVDGSDFTYGNGIAGPNTVTGGTITTITIMEGSTVLGVMDGLNEPAGTLLDAIAQIPSDFTIVNAILDAYSFTYDATAVTGGFASAGLYAQDDIFLGGDSDNAFRGNDGVDTYHGGGGNDALDYGFEQGGQGVNVNLALGTGTDTYGNAETFDGMEKVWGSQYGDFLVGDDSDNGNLFEGRNGSDTMDGAGGFDTLWYQSEPNFGATHGIDANLATGIVIDGFGNTDHVSNMEAVVGTDFDDTIVGNDADNDFEGRAGADTYDGGDGSDAVVWQDEEGGNGVFADLSTGASTDTYGNAETLTSIERLHGSRYDDLFIGSNVDELFEGRDGSDTIDGGGGNDVIWYRSEENLGGFQGINANLSTGIVIDGFGNTDFVSNVENVYGTSFSDTIVGDAADNDLTGWNGADSYDGGDGFDGVNFEEEQGANGVVVDLAAGTATDSWGNAETLTNIERVNGSHNDDTLSGDNDENDLHGRGGNDVLSGLDGRDHLSGDDGDDTLIGGNGEDDLEGGAGADVFDGGADSDAVAWQNEDGGNGVFADLSTGLSTDTYGNDETLTSIERLHGSRYDDHFIGSNVDELFEGRDGSDTIDGGGGGDVVWYRSEEELGGFQGINANLATGIVIDGFNNTDFVSNVENVYGTSFSDTIVGDAADNDFTGWNGGDSYDGGDGFDGVRYDEEEGANGVTADLGTGTATDSWGNAETLANIERVIGSQNNDTLSGNNESNDLQGRGGNDSLTGFDGNDHLSGDDGNDTLIGGDGDDDLAGGGGIDIYVGGNGSDAAQFSDENGAFGAVVNLSTGSGSDTYGNIETFVSIERIHGSQNDDLFIGSGAGELFEGRRGDDTIDGGGSDDVLYYGSEADQGGNQGINANLAAGTVIDGFGDTDTVTNVENVSGTRFDDVIVGNGADNSFSGEDGSDSYDGAGGFDAVQYRNENGGQGVVVDLAAGTGTDTFGKAETYASIERVDGSDWDDELTGDAFDNWFEGLGGNDTIDGAGGFDEVNYGNEESKGGFQGVVVDLLNETATDTFAFTDELISIEAISGTNFADSIAGSNDDNFLTGEGDNDTMGGAGGFDNLQGNDGDDRLEGGADGDFLAGGSGADTFVYASSSDGGDFVDDFETGTDMIEIDAGGFGGGLGAGSLAANYFVSGSGVGATEGGHGQFLYDTDTGDLYWDEDGTGAGAAQHIATLGGTPSLSAADFTIV